MTPARRSPVSLSATPASRLMDWISSFCPPFKLSFLGSSSSHGGDESPTESQDRLVSPSGSSGGSVNGTEEGGADNVRSRELRRLRREIEDLKGQVESQGAEMVKLRGEEEALVKECEHKRSRVAELESEIGQMRGHHREDAQRRTQHIQATEERLRRTEELLATRSAELTGAQAFLSTTDHLSEAEVLGIVRDLNENIYQVAVKLTEEWENLESPLATSRMEVDPASQPSVPVPVPVLVQLVRDRDYTGLTFLLQSCLCSQVVNMTSSWGHHQELAALDSVYQRISASGKYRIVCTGGI